MMNPSALRPRDRDALIQSLRAGVTPRMGTKHIQVGRDAELTKNLATRTKPTWFWYSDTTCR